MKKNLHMWEFDNQHILLIPWNQVLVNVAIAFFSMGELESEMGVLRVGLKDIEKELDFTKKKGIADGIHQDKFVSVMRDFITVAAYNFSELEDQMKEMKQKVSTNLRVLFEIPL